MDVVPRTCWRNGKVDDDVACEWPPVQHLNDAGLCFRTVSGVNARSTAY